MAVVFSFLFIFGTTQVLASLTFSNTGVTGDSSFAMLSIPGISTSGCLTISNTGVVSSTGSPCGSGGGGVPYTGATGNVDLGTHNLTANSITVTGGGPSSITLQTAPVGNPSAGAISYWGDTTQKKLCTKDDTGVTTCMGSGGSMVFPGVGVANSTGSAWGTSYTVGTGASNLVQLDSSSKLPAVDGSQLTNLPSGGGGFDPTDPSIYWLKDDFPGVRPDAAPNGELSWQITGTSGNVIASAATAGHPGVKAVNTTVVLDNRAYPSLSYSAVFNWWNLGATSAFTSWVTRNIVNVDNASGVAPISNVGYYFGLGTTSGTSCGGGGVRGWCIAADTAPTITCAVGLSNGVASVAWNSANWMYTMSNASNTTCLDSGVPANSGTWYDLKILSSPVGNVTYSINGSNAFTISTGSPTDNMNPIMVVVTRTTAIKTAWQDFWSFKGVGLTR